MLTWGLHTVLVCACACGSSPSGIVDSDGDGFGRDEDCADGDPLRFPGADERCNGFDDDCDGVVDEGFPDTDGDGRLDCYGDASCELVEGPVLEVERTCPPAAERPWDVVEKWSWRAPDEPSIGGAAGGVVASHLDDDDDDGDIGSAGDAVEICGVFSELNPELAERRVGRLAILDGATGTTERLSEPDWYAWSGLAVADLDVDGTPDIVGIAREGGSTLDDPPVLRARAVTPGGDLLWRSEPLCPECFSVVGPPFDRRYVSRAQPVRPTVADLDSDGQPEVLVDRFVLDGTSGETVLRLEVLPHRSMVPVDLDGDGDVELLANGRAYLADGTLLWVREGGLPVGVDHPFVIDMDGDGLPEAGFLANRSGDTTVDILSGDGDDLLRLSLRRPAVPLSLLMAPSPPSVIRVAQTDSVRDSIRIGGFSSEAASSPFHTWLAVATGVARSGGGDPSGVEVELTDLGVATVSFSGSGFGVVSFDFDGDGAWDDVVSRAGVPLVLQSVDTVRWSGGQSPPFHSPLLVDVDGDGSCDVVAHPVTEAADLGGVLLTVYGHRDGGWMACGRTWPQFEFRPGWIDDDGTVNTDAESRATGMTRARPVTEPTVDLEVAIVGRCLASCAGELRVAVQVGNRGTYPASEGVARLEVATGDGDVLASAPVPALGGLEVSDPLELVVPDLDGVWDSRVVVRLALTDDAPAQCDTANDVVEWDFSEACAPLR